MSPIWDTIFWIMWNAGSGAGLSAIECRTGDDRHMEIFSLTGKRALVTGSSRGLGLEMARALASAGAHVVLNGRYEDTLRAGVAEIEAAGGSASISVFDVSDEAAALGAMDQMAADFGGIDILINNAGIVHRAELKEFTTEDYARVVHTNLTSCFYMARHAAGCMTGQKFGRIINIASVLSVLGRPTVPAYISAKAGLAGLTRGLAVELGPDGVTCNAIAPGYFATELNAALVEDPEFNQFVCDRTPLGRWGDPAELGGAAVFLASPAGAYVNGHLLVIDGGMTVKL